ncbi:hypothetical protein EVAR_67829_1 [Eumeta japonica]|uniref:Uncharacterized protein n=1 Tax=Eumeta variegata TaxID=151549 RepID=A0A4C1ZU83_EUMVA|nr:hypothetical protein EVAR_67829_1 [Eumeta japonica]
MDWRNGVAHASCPFQYRTEENPDSRTKASRKFHTMTDRDKGHGVYLRRQDPYRRTSMLQLKPTSPKIACRRPPRRQSLTGSTAAVGRYSRVLTYGRHMVTVAVDVPFSVLTARASCARQLSLSTKGVLHQGRRKTWATWASTSRSEEPPPSKLMRRSLSH